MMIGIKRKIRRNSVFLALFLSAALFGKPAVAGDRALLVGVGSYQNTTSNSLELPGIDLDLEIMRRVAANLGFAPAGIKVLFNQAATQSAVQSHLDSWLRTGVGPGDRVLIYFSTHGTQVKDKNGDEEDGLDEALTLYDLNVGRNASGEPNLTGILLDDDFERALAAIPTQNVLVLVDACYSGTVTRGVHLESKQSGFSEAVLKSFSYPGMPSPKAHTRGLGDIVPDVPPKENYVSVSAASDDERSLATEGGSLFTQGLARTVSQAAGAGGSLTPRQIMQEAAVFVATQLGKKDEARIFHPQLGGNPRLADRPLPVAAVTAGQGPIWTRLDRLAGGMPRLALQANHTEFREGEKLELTIDVPRAGYLNVINVDAQDTPIVTFPNRFHPSNQVPAGRISIPGTLPFELPASPPYGPVLLVAFVTDRPVNLYESGDGRRNDAGKMLEDFPRLSEIGVRGFVPTGKTSGPEAAGKLEVKICPRGGCR